MRSPDTFPPIDSRGDVAVMVLSGATLIVTLAANSTGATITAFDVVKKAMAFETVQTNILKLGAHAVSNNCYFQLDALGRVWRFNLTNGKVDTMEIPTTDEEEITLMKPASKYLYITYDSAMWIICPLQFVVLAKYPSRGPILNLLFSPKARVPSTLAVGSVILGTDYGYIVSTLSHEFLKAPVNIDFDFVDSIYIKVVQSAGKLCFGFGREKSSAACINATNGADHWWVDLHTESDPDHAPPPAIVGNKVFFLCCSHRECNDLQVLSSATGKLLGRIHLPIACNYATLYPDGPNLVIKCDWQLKLFRITDALELQVLNFSDPITGAIGMSDTMLFAPIGHSVHGISKEPFHRKFVAEDVLSTNGDLTFAAPSYLYLGTSTSHFYIHNATDGRAMGAVTRDPPFVFGGSVFILGDNGGLSKTPIGSMDTVQHLQVDDRSLGSPSISSEGIMLFVNGYGIFAVDAIAMRLLWSLKADFCSDPHVHGHWAFVFCMRELYCYDVRSGDLLLQTTSGLLAHPAYRDNTVYFSRGKDYTSITLPPL